MNNKNVKITATELKNNLSDILNKVIYEDVQYSVYRHGKEVVTLIKPDPKEKLKEIREGLKKYKGSMPNFPDVKKYRTKNTFPF